jgi:hypothetical protein
MKGDEVSGGICRAWKRREMFTEHSWEKLEDIGVNWRIMLK